MAINSKKLRIDNEIKADRVLYIDHEGKQIGVLETAQACKLANEAGFNLVEVSPMSDVPVCKAIDYGQYKYRQGKKSSAKSKHQRKQQIKKVKFRPVTDVGDYQVKCRKIREFLGEGYKVEVFVRFKGREITHEDLGYDLLQRLQDDLSDAAEIDKEPKLEGRQMMMMLLPKKV